MSKKGGGNVVDFNGITYGRVSPKKVLEGAIEDDLETVIVIGWTKDKTLACYSSDGRPSEELMLLEAFRQQVLEGMFDE